MKPIIVLENAIIKMSIILFGMMVLYYDTLLIINELDQKTINGGLV